MSEVLLLTQPRDVHAFAVAEALRRKGGRPVLWHTSDFPSQMGESVAFRGTAARTKLKGPELDLIDPNFVTVWHRRPSFALDSKLLHPADQRFAELECNVFRRSLFSIMLKNSFWVNPPDAAVVASRKLVQHTAALEVGLQVPDTLYTNDPDEIRGFIREHGGKIIYKPFQGISWQGNETSWMPYTSLLQEDQLVSDEILRSVPGIYQELIEKDSEARVTVIGKHLLSAKILSQDTTGGRVDWRKAYDELKMEPLELPDEISGRCLALLDKLGLVFGCFDFIIKPGGEFVFLEVNEMGQFLFVESYTGLPLLDAFSEFLLQGRVDFQWDRSQKAIAYHDVREKADFEAAASAARHVSAPVQTIWEGRGDPPKR